ncbi:Histidine--tRNA ligase [Bertholletia excelsa]
MPGATASPCSLLILHPRLTLFLRPSSLPTRSSSALASFTTKPWLSFLPKSTHYTSSRRQCSSFSSSSLASSLNENPASAGRSASLSLPPVFDSSSKIEVNPPKGTRDFPPEEMRLRSWLFQNFREVEFQFMSTCLALFGFEEVDFPVLESEALFIRKAGEEIRDQLYCFEDRGNRRVALRPELTPSLARLVIQKGKSISLPLKWFAVGQCWRYERMTRGRRREHYQWNMDIIGVHDVTVSPPHFFVSFVVVVVVVLSLSLSLSLSGGDTFQK